MLPQEDQAMVTGDLHMKFCKNWSGGYRDMLADRQTHRQMGWSQYSATLPGQSNNQRTLYYTSINIHDGTEDAVSPLAAGAFTFAFVVHTG